MNHVFPRSRRSCFLPTHRLDIAFVQIRHTVCEPVDGHLAGFDEVKDES